MTSKCVPISPSAIEISNARTAGFVLLSAEELQKNYDLFLEIIDLNLNFCPAGACRNSAADV
jgi:hypothetical protein